MHRLALLGVLAAVSAGCSTTTHEYQVDRNPLPVIAERAEASGRWGVERIHENELHLTELWPVHSAISLGVSELHVDLRYEEPMLHGEYYLRTQGVKTLFLPQRLHVESSVFGAPMKPRMQKAVREILDWGEVPLELRPEGFR